MTNGHRSNPDELLNSIKKQEVRRGRGKLRVFFGMSPGVGKTYSMLRAAQEQKKSGMELVVGLVETHQRSETQALLEGLVVLPRKNIEYKGTVFEELNLDLILDSKPTLVLIDELAHTNVPGSRHPKRYQDVEEILQAGISVYTTLNVQHVESRADLVQEIAGVPIRETVPDSFLELSDQIELVDLSPQELLKRLREGRVYLGDRAERAAQNFFKEEHLTALRELALRFTADKVDVDLKDQMTVKGIAGPWRANERLLVAISHSPYSARLIRATRRMSYSLEAPWIALYVNNDERLNSEDQITLTKNINLAKELGAEVITTRDSSISRAIKRIALEKNVTQIVMGRPDRRFFRDIIARGTVLDQLVRETSGIDVHVIRQERKPIFRGFRLPWMAFEAGFFPYWFVFWFLSALSSGSYVLKDFVGYRVVSYFFLLGVLIVSSMSSLGPILFAASFSALVWNFFFIPPTFTFVISNPEDMMMCLAYFFVAILGGYLTTRIRRQEADLIQREHRSNVLYELGRAFADARTANQIAIRGADCVEKLFEMSVAVLPGKSANELNPMPLNHGVFNIMEKDIGVATWSFLNNRKAGYGTDTLSSARCLCVPLMGRGAAIGVMVLYPKNGMATQLTLEQENLLDTIASYLAITLEREHFEIKAKETQMLQESEKLHQTILNSVSHELKTPLTSIIGASSALQDPATAAREEVRLTLTQELIGSAERLNRVVENLLDMSRLSSGVMTIKHELFDINDLVRSTLRRSEKFLSSHKIEVQLTPRDLYCEGDDRLLEHCLLNLLSNAVTYSNAGTKITITTFERNAAGVLEVTDEGYGLPLDATEKIFEKFYRLPGSPTGGTGLGLSIAKNIVEAHKGKISAYNREDRPGAVLRIELPLSELPEKLIEGQL